MEELESKKADLEELIELPFPLPFPGEMDHGRNKFLLYSPIHEGSARAVCDWILSENQKTGPARQNELTLFINSPGGDVHHGFAIIDCIKGSQIPVNTVGLGMIASMGLMIFMTGKDRILTPNTVVMSHEFWAGTQGSAHSLFNEMDHMKWLLDRIYDHYKKSTGLDLKTIKKELLKPNEDTYLKPSQAKKFKICNRIKLV